MKRHSDLRTEFYARVRAETQQVPENEKRLQEAVVALKKSVASQTTELAELRQLVTNLTLANAVLRAGIEMSTTISAAGMPDNLVAFRQRQLTPAGLGRARSRSFVGVAGTLGAAVFTQIWSTRREDRRWRQEQAAESQRWERQQQERRDQWRREDQLRRVAQRQEAYTQFLLAVAAWASAAYALIVEGDGQPRVPAAEDLSRLTGLVDQAEAARVPLRLHGSPEVSAATEEVCRVMTSAVRAFAGGALTIEQMDQVLVEFRRTSQAALAQARTDLDLN